MSGTGGTVQAIWDEVVVLVGVRRWDGRPSTVERLAAPLAEHAAVLVVVPDPMPATSDGDGRLRVVGPRLARAVAPGLPGGRPSSVARIDAALLRRSVRRTLVALGSPRVRGLVVSSSLAQLGSIGEDRRVLLVADDLLDGWVVPAHRVPRLERSLHRALGAADVVLAGSPLLAEVLHRAGIDAVVVPDGLDDDVFESVELDAGRSVDRVGDRPIVGFVGDLAGDVDLEVLDGVASAGHDLLLVGRGPRGPVSPALARVVRRSNVEWVGPRSADEVPGLVARCRIGIVPLVDSRYTRARLPLDSLVHLAAGQPLVGTDCEPLRWLRAPGSGLDDRDVTVAGPADDVATLVAERLARPGDLVSERRRRRFAADHRRSARAAQLASILEVREPGAVEAAR